MALIAVDLLRKFVAGQVMVGGRFDSALLFGVLACLALQGCADQIEETCANPSYLVQWACERPHVWHNSNKAYGDALADKVRAGQMSDADAKLALLQFEQQSRASRAAAFGAAGTWRPRTCSPLGAGFTCY